MKVLYDRNCSGISNKFPYVKRLHVACIKFGTLDEDVNGAPHRRVALGAFQGTARCVGGYRSSERVRVKLVAMAAVECRHRLDALAPMPPCQFLERPLNGPIPWWCDIAGNRKNLQEISQTHDIM
ncbi:hypothetical protein NECAME_07957 [Necator americanus]|uniref:Uncharacterized protein n=1 Tax=Necator americanus TaxID=51031 RepID=W2TLC1_NECAM|nr:hypothetical protein NECAME_07957 [Necator americanus]ETN82429.1 hypothetical protein NECAME_07957 [Necator americanus]